MSKNYTYRIFFYDSWSIFYETRVSNEFWLEWNSLMFVTFFFCEAIAEKQINYFYAGKPRCRPRRWPRGTDYRSSRRPKRRTEGISILLFIFWPLKLRNLTLYIHWTRTAILHNVQSFLTICLRCWSFQYPFECLFRSQHYALLDNGCREYLFVSDFFMVTGSSAQDLFNLIFGKTLTMFMVGMLTL